MYKIKTQINLEEHNCAKLSKQCPLRIVILINCNSGYLCTVSAGIKSSGKDNQLLYQREEKYLIQSKEIGECLGWVILLILSAKQ